MGIAFDHCEDRPAHIDSILAGLERYNPETTKIFQAYVTSQCEDKTYDCYANLALLKLYQFNPDLTRDDTVTSILTKALTVFPSPDYSLCLHLLPANILGTPSPSNPFSTAAAAAASLSTNNSSSQRFSKKPTDTQNPLPGSLTTDGPAPVETPLVEAIHKLTLLNTLLEAADYAQFWDTLDSDDLYADLTSDVAGFEELMRVRIAVNVGQTCREVAPDVLGAWLNLKPGTAGFDAFVADICGWDVSGVKSGGTIKVPTNKENEAKSVIVREDVKFDHFARVVGRGFEVAV